MASSSNHELAPGGGRTGLPLGEWTLKSPLGGGAMGTVYLAVNEAGQEAAIKIAHPQVAADPDQLARFQREADVLERVAGHPGAVAFFGAGVTPEGCPYVVLERLAGQELGQYWERHGRRLEVEESVRIAEAVLELLDHCHRRGIVHRDLKPANVFVCEDGRIKVLDFGVAKAADAGQPQRPEGTVGTAGYMAPEQAVGRSDLADARADVFALGAILYQLLSGVRLRRGTSFEQIFLEAGSTAPPSLAQVAPGLPIELIHLVDKALAWDPRDRFQTARHMKSALGHFKAGPRQVARLPEGVGGSLPVPVVATDEDAPVQKAELVLALRDLLRALERALEAAHHYGWSHAETHRRLDVLQGLVEQALHDHPAEVQWAVKPSAFMAGEEVVWEPEPPLDAIPYGLFGAGVHFLQLLEGLGRDELERFVRFLAEDALKQELTDEDLGVRLWELGFDHLKFQLVAGFQFVEIEGGETPGEPRPEEPKLSADQQELLAMLMGRGEQAMAEARAMRLGIAQGLTGTEGAALYAPPDEERARALRSCLSQAEHDVARISVALVHALLDAGRRKDGERLAPTLEALVPGFLRADQPQELIQLLLAVLTGLEPAPALQSAFVRGAVGPDQLSALLGAIAALAREQPDARLEVLPILEQLGPGAVEAVIAVAPRAVGPLYEDLLQFLLGNSRGFEKQLGAALPNATLEHGKALLRVLTVDPTESGRQAMGRAQESPSPELRLAALEAAAQTWPQAIAEIAAPYFTHADPAVRIRVLRALEASQDPALVPPVVRRLESPDLDELPAPERRMLLELLHRLDPGRAEEVALGLLAAKGGLARILEPSPARALAIQYLGQHAASLRAADALEQAAQSRWSAGADLRRQATAAAEQVRQRRQERKP